MGRCTNRYKYFIQNLNGCKTANKTMAHVHIIAKMIAKEGKSEELVQILNNLVETTRTESRELYLMKSIDQKINKTNLRS
jgi:hypothetical protein